MTDRERVAEAITAHQQMCECQYYDGRYACDDDDCVGKRVEGER